MLKNILLLTRKRQNITDTFLKRLLNKLIRYISLNKPKRLSKKELKTFWLNRNLSF